MGIMRAILGSHQRPADGCANLSLVCRLPATASSLGIKDKNKEAHAPLGYSSSSAIKASSRSLRNSLPFSVICQC
ncbi:Uncharacterised protein [Vibrio cholerae]|nr:Uncharacterised protein [Vibrio cholerae]CSB35767.1 Uncharacterised protein [Vibrio cholerae]